MDRYLFRSGHKQKTKTKHNRQFLLEVAKRLSPDITATLSSTISSALKQLQSEITSQGGRLEEAEQRIASLGDDLASSQLSCQKALKETEWLRDRVDDLENRSRRNKLRIVGLLESILVCDLKSICEKELPEALNLTTPKRVERVHRIGPPSERPLAQSSTTKDRPRQGIMRFLDFTDKEDLLRAYCRLQSLLQLRGFKILMFSDYSAEVNKKRRAFSTICTALHKKNICFQLLYPAVLKIRKADGAFLTLSSPKEAEQFLLSQCSSDSPSHRAHHIQDGNKSPVSQRGQVRQQEDSSWQLGTKSKEQRSPKHSRRPYKDLGT